MIPLLFLLLIPTVFSEYEASMVKIYGNVSNEVPSQLVLDEETCTSNCLNNQECILAYMSSEGYCNNYDYSMITDTVEVVKGEKEEGLKVAFKTNLLTCPATFTSMDFAYVDRRNLANRPFKWTTTPTGWTLPKNPCPPPWYVSERSGTVTVCMRYYETPELDQAGAKAYCQELGYHLSGIDNQNEVDFFVDAGLNMWTDGSTECPDCSCTQPPLYTYADTYTPNRSQYFVYDTFMACSYQLGPCVVLLNQQFLFMAHCTDKYKAVVCGFKMVDL
uniref:CW domain-containing protein n=1 Tax=Caenorhabditis tropicalis TaxID=1561998 RepID=A0A1I7U3W5_9PELO